MPRRVDDYRGLTQPNRFRLLRAVQLTPGRDAHALADDCGLPLNTVRDHLHVLEDEGLIFGRPAHGGGRGRPKIEFHPVRDTASNRAARERVQGAVKRGELYRAVARAGADAATSAPLEPAAAAQLDVLYEHLEDVGLEPAWGEDPLTIDLEPCRYHDMIESDRAAACAVHACLVRDMLQQVRGPLALKVLNPFVTEHRCRITLAAAEPATAVG